MRSFEEVLGLTLLQGNEAHVSLLGK